MTAEQMKLYQGDKMKEFRMTWAKNLAAEIEDKKTHTKTWRKVDTTTWNFRPFGSLVVHLGGWNDPEAVKGACTGALQCLMMGDPFVKIHPQTKMVNFAIAEIGWSEIYDESWTQTLTYLKKNDQPAIGNDASKTELKGAGTSTAEEQVAEGKSTKNTGKATPKSGGKKKKKIVKSTEKETAEKKRHQTIFKDAARVKSKVTTASLRAVEIETEIQKNGKYAWARNNEKGDKLIKSQVSSLKNDMTDWHRDYMIAIDLGEMKKKYSIDRIAMELTSFTALEKKVDRMKAICDTIVKATDLMDV